MAVPLLARTDCESAKPSARLLTPERFPLKLSLGIKSTSTFGRVTVVKILAVGIGGFIGSCCRYGLTLLLSRFAFLPFGTLASNVIAALAIGFIISAERQTAMLPENIRLFLTVGLLGGLSTFSTFSIETVNMIENSQYIHAAGNIILNLCLSIIFVFAGLQLAKLLVKA